MYYGVRNTMYYGVRNTMSNLPLLPLLSSTPTPGRMCAAAAALAQTPSLPGPAPHPPQTDVRACAVAVRAGHPQVMIIIARLTTGVFRMCGRGRGVGRG